MCQICVLVPGQIKRPTGKEGAWLQDNLDRMRQGDHSSKGYLVPKDHFGHDSSQGFFHCGTSSPLALRLSIFLTPSVLLKVYCRPDDTHQWSEIPSPGKQFWNCFLPAQPHPPLDVPSSSSKAEFSDSVFNGALRRLCLFVPVHTKTLNDQWLPPLLAKRIHMSLPWSLSLIEGKQLLRTLT